MLDEGQLSHRNIALKLGVSRGTIGAIASGRLGIHGRESGPEITEYGFQESAPERCHDCGAMVYKPCVLCRTLAYRSRRRWVHIRKVSPQRCVA